MKADQPFEVLPYNRSSLAYALCNEFISPEALLKVGKMIPEKDALEDVEIPGTKVRLLQGGNLFNFPYLLTYFADAPNGLGAKTILVEPHFTSREYLSDYASYYATCKRRYEKECKRIHFFSKEYSFEEISAWLFGSAYDSSAATNLEEHYLGYVVVKPIPFSFMGTTLLKPYPNVDEGRIFSATREYRVNIFGRVLKIQTLAFQSQDKATSACASSALWSALHKTSIMFQTQCPSPSEITIFSGNLYTSEGRTFPNSGLDHHQLCKAIEKVGLVSELRNHFSGWDLQVFKGFIYGYLRMGLPVLLGMQIVGAEKHLITITGYRKEPLSESHQKEFNLVSDVVTRFYAHDDQLGPFSRIAIEGTEDAQYPCGIKIVTGWPIDGSFDDLRTAKLASLVIPMHQFMRIGYEEIYHLAKRLDGLIDEGGTNNVWDIFLDDGSRLKTEFAGLMPPPGKRFHLQYLHSILARPMPRFVWRAQLYFQGLHVMELFFDATDVPRGHYLIAVIFHNPDFQSLMGALLRIDDQFSKELDESFGPQFKNILLKGAEIPIFGSQPESK